MYQTVKTPSGELASTVKRLTDNAFIPLSPDNTDYQQYLKWLSEGNTPTPADEGA
jgi:hypothetical protein